VQQSNWEIRALYIIEDLGKLNGLRNQRISERASPGPNYSDRMIWKNRYSPHPRQIVGLACCLFASSKHIVHFLALRGRAGQPGPRAENRERGERETRWFLATACHFFAMSEERRQVRKAGLAFALAQGSSLAAWRRGHNVPPRTAYRWSSDPKVTAAVHRIRRAFLEQAAGMLGKNATAAASGMIKLGQDAKSETVKLRAFRALFSDVITLTEFAVLEGRVAEVEEQIRERDRKHAARPAP
jgi:hypothetical protein